MSMSGFPDYFPPVPDKKPCQACREDHAASNNHPDFETEEGGDDCDCCMAHHTLLSEQIAEIGRQTARADMHGHDLAKSKEREADKDRYIERLKEALAAARSEKGGRN